MNNNEKKKQNGNVERIQFATPCCQFYWNRFVIIALSEMLRDKCILFDRYIFVISIDKIVSCKSVVHCKVNTHDSFVPEFTTPLNRYPISI